METNKKNLRIVLLDVLNDNFPELSQAQRERLSSILSAAANNYNIETNKDFHAQYTEISLKYEQSRASFTNYINYLKNMSEKLMKVYRDKGFVKVEYDAAKNKNVMTFRTNVLQETVLYMNGLNDLVIKYHEDVMEQKQEKSREQHSLF